MTEKTNDIFTIFDKKLTIFLLNLTHELLDRFKYTICQSEIILG